MDLGVAGSTIFGIAVSLVIMWLSLRRYEGFFDERVLFRSLIIGFVTGFLAFFIEILTYNVGILFLVIFPLVEQFLKLIGINLPFYYGKKETVVYGLVLGLGFGSIHAPLLIVGASRGMGLSFHILLGSLVMGIGYILFHGGTGCMLGYGVYRSDRWRYLFYATILGFPLPLLEISTFYFGDIMVTIILRGIESMYSLAVFLIVHRKILPYALPRKKRKELL